MRKARQFTLDRKASHPRRRHRVDLDDGDAFLPDFRRGFVEAADGDVEALGEEFIAAATSAETVAELARNEVVDDGFLVMTYDAPEARTAVEYAKAR